MGAASLAYRRLPRYQREHIGVPPSWVRVHVRTCVCVASNWTVGACMKSGRGRRKKWRWRRRRASNKHVVERDCLAHIGLYCIRCLSVRERRERRSEGRSREDGRGINSNYSYFGSDYKAVEW